MKGTRVYLPDPNMIPVEVEKILPLGGYAYMPRCKLWYFKAPNGDVGTNGDHKITEHEDGTLTVSPSLQFMSGKRWHGWLERGVWREA